MEYLMDTRCWVVAFYLLMWSSGRWFSQIYTQINLYIRLSPSTNPIENATTHLSDKQLDSFSCHIVLKHQIATTALRLWLLPWTQIDIITG